MIGGTVELWSPLIGGGLSSENLYGGKVSRKKVAKTKFLLLDAEGYALLDADGYCLTVKS